MRIHPPIAAAFLLCPALVFAQGRRPDPDKDTFPDYNRLELHPRMRTPEEAAAVTISTNPATSPPAEAPTPPKVTPLNTPVNPLPDEDLPKPPPKAVPVPEGASEPPLPDVMSDTLIPKTTAQ